MSESSLSLDECYEDFLLHFFFRWFIKKKRRAGDKVKANIFQCPCRLGLIFCYSLRLWTRALCFAFTLASGEAGWINKSGGSCHRKRPWNLCFSSLSLWLSWLLLFYGPERKGRAEKRSECSEFLNPFHDGTKKCNVLVGISGSPVKRKTRNETEPALSSNCSGWKVHLISWPANHCTRILVIRSKFEADIYLVQRQNERRQYTRKFIFRISPLILRLLIH